MEGSSFNPRIGTGEGESPIVPRPTMPPSPSIETRTFSSDLGSIRNTGGAEPVPYTPAPAKPSTLPSGIALGSTFPKPGGTPPSTTPPTSPGVSSSPIVPPPPVKAGGKKVFAAVLSFLIVVALGAVGYFFVYPLFVEEAPAETVETPPVTLPETDTPEIPEIPEGDATLPEEVPEVSAPDPWSGVSGIASHASLFRTRADTTTEVILSAPTLAAFKSALPSGSVATPLFSEAVLKMPSGSVLPFSQLATLIAPTFFTSARLASFDEDATYFTYAAANGTWFGIVAPLKAGVPVGPIQDTMSALQSDPDLANFFLENPGEKGAWADGSVRERPTSQVSFETPGATLSYTWFDRNLLISTNLTGAGIAAERLGF